MNCLDAYVLMEISCENLNFVGLLKYDFLIPDITMAEFYRLLFRNFNEATADYWLEKFKHKCVQVRLDILIKAAKYKEENKKTNMSFVDAVGYIYALENNFTFVTGDKEFKDRKNVLYIK